MGKTVSLYKLKVFLKKYIRILIPAIVIIVILIIIFMPKPEIVFEDFAEISDVASAEDAPNWYLIEKEELSSQIPLVKIKDQASIIKAVNPKTSLNAFLQGNEIHIQPSDKSLDKIINLDHTGVDIFIKWIDNEKLLIVEKEKNTADKIDYLYFYDIKSEKKKYITDDMEIPGRIDFDFDIQILNTFKDDNPDNKKIVRIGIKEKNYERGWILRFLPDHL